MSQTAALLSALDCLPPAMSLQLPSLSSKSRSVVGKENRTEADSTLQSNRLLPVFRLYFDLLQYIFLLGANDETNHHLRRRRVLSYAQTCRDWRIAALGVKHLWRQLAEFDVMSWVWNEEMLRRSHPLTVVVGSRTWPPRDATVVVKELAYMERIRTYRLGFTAETWEDVVEGLQSPSETLEYLSLAHIPRKSHQNQRRLILPSTIFSSSAPRLRQLKLEGCFIDPGTPALRQLTSLTIIDIDKCYNTAPTIQEWTKLLGTMPLLVELSLKNAISSSTSSLRPRRKNRIRDPLASPGMGFITHQSSTTRSARPVLRKLERLYLEGPLPEVAALLAATDLPGAVEISLVCTECHVGEELESIERFWARNLRQSFERRRTERAPRPVLPLLLSASNSRVCLRSDEHVLLSATALISAMAAEPQSAPSLLVPPFYLDIRGSQDSSWEVLLPSILSELSDPLDETTDNSSPLASVFSSLEIALPSPHLDILPFLAKCVNTEVLVNIPGGIGGWLFQELKISTKFDVSQSHSYSQPLTSSNSPNWSLLPHLRMISLCDDRCMYGSAWKFLVGCLQTRCTNHSEVLPSPTSGDHGKDNGFQEVQSSRSNTFPIEMIAFKNSRLAKDKLAALTDLGVRVVGGAGRKAL